MKTLKDVRKEIKRLQAKSFNMADSSPTIAYELGRLDGMLLTLEVINTEKNKTRKEF